MSITPRITEGMSSQRLLADLRRAQHRTSISEAQLSGGRELLDAAMDPLRTQRSLLMRQDLSQAESLRDNVGLSVGWMETTDGALATINDLVHRARELTVAGGSGTLADSDRDAMAEEIGKLIESVKLAANARFNDAYVFGGQATDAAPYDPTGADTYAGDTGGIVRTIGPGVSMQINVVGDSVLGNGADGRLLNTLRTLHQALANNTTADQNALRTTVLRDLDRNLGDVLSARATVGTGLNRLAFAAGRLDDQILTTKDHLSENEDTDIAETVIKLKTDQSIYQAALSSGASIIKPSLMDFLR